MDILPDKIDVLWDIFLSLKLRIFNPNGFIFELLEKLIFIMEQKIHQGRNVKRFREMLNIKQEALAYDLGEDWNQKKISLLEQKDVIEDNLLKQISAVLKIPVEAFQNFDEEQAVNLISCNFSDNAMFNNKIEVFNNNPIEEIKKLHEEKIALFERMLKEKDEMMVRLEKLIGK
ncbi:Helix-turn-helix domain-containing protein [Flavobacterium defluvii]|uniref:Helix-turn-helix domain-containing protein n=2 Tax=Flavobacterium defluvii TaxID=370979 RepID=A0A1M5IVI2_9FLAO|nr:Helix-turn-helix domain-containing protein [Flavobacterium defluvii]